MARKVFISVLGATFYEECVYGVVEDKKDEDTVQKEKNDLFRSTKTRFVQQATLEYLDAKSWEPTDIAYIFTTEKAKKDNWNESITERERYKDGPMVPYTGLQKILTEMGLPFTPESEDIPDGNDEAEMWQIFKRIYNKIEDGDELYFDLTHSFRYIPMLALVLGNYSKFLKNIKVCSITYGNYEVSKNREDKIAPIIDLMPLTILQDWTYAAADLIRNGNSDRLRELSNNSYLTQMLRLKEPERKLNNNESIAEGNIKNYIEALHKMLMNLRLCQLPQILNGETISEVKTKFQYAQKQLNTEINDNPTNAISIIPPILNKIKDTFKDFSSNEDIKNGYYAANWCYLHQLYQQAITILHENITTHLCQYLSINHRNYNSRKAASDFLRRGGFNQDDWNKVDPGDINSTNRNKNKVAVKNFISKFKDIFEWTTEKRNSYDHASMSMKYDVELRKDKEALFSASDVEKLGNIISEVLKITDKMIK